ncbi:MAG: hypothetical protein PHS14_04895 [Elusimicrobia bacterium]|nr:hypothetical protein [Elusimicrobiota bacterium]
MSGTARSPRYTCETCRDSGSVWDRHAVRVSNDPEAVGDFVPCTACDGKSRLAGEIDEPAAIEKTLAETAFACRACGPRVAVDEDGCCVTCGRDTTEEEVREPLARNTR